MTKQHPKPAYQPIQKLSQSSRENILISQVLNEQGKTLILSRFRDNEWDLSPYIYTKNTPKHRKQINFAIKFANGICLTDACHVSLLNSVKAFIYAR